MAPKTRPLETLQPQGASAPVPDALYDRALAHGMSRKGAKMPLCTPGVLMVVVTCGITAIWMAQVEAFPG